MKRVYNDVPVISVLFTVPGTVTVTIEDYSHGAAGYPGARPLEIRKLKACESYSLPDKYGKAKIRELCPGPEPNSLTIKISTQYEQY